MMRVLAAMLVLVVTGGGPALAQPPVLPRVAVDVSLDQAAAASALSASLPVATLLRVSADLPGDEPRLLELLDGRREGSIWLALTAPRNAAAVDSFRTSLRTLLSARASAVAVLEVVVAVGGDAGAADYAVRVAATEARSRSDQVHVALGGPRASEPGFYSPALAPYVDLLSLPAPADTAAAAALIAGVDPGAAIAVTGLETGDGPDAVRTVVSGEAETLGTDVVLQAWRPSPALPAALRALAPIAPLLSAEVATLDPTASGLRLLQDGQDVTASVPHRLLFDARSFATYLLYWPTNETPLDVSLRLPVEGTPAVYRLLDRSRHEPLQYARNADTAVAIARLPGLDGPVLVNFSEGAAGILTDATEVTAERQLSVEEIIARHQRQQRAQDDAVRRYIAVARSDQHFRPTMTDPGYDVSSENRYFVEGDEVEWEELSFSVNGTKWGADRPAFPLLQPEKVLSLPLQLRFGDDYRYRLAGTERVDGFDCYVLRFEPLDAGRALYRGTLWIDRRTFARVKVQAVQTGLTGPVVSNEEIQTYAPVGAIGNQPIFLFTGLTARQIVMIAGRNILVEKSVAFSDFRLNPADFAAARIEARRGDRIMYRETDRGLRYFVKDGEDRVVSDRATLSAKAMAMGVTLDPSFGFPLPIFGINYLDFEFRNPDTQLAVLFAGVLAAGNVQRPKLGTTPFDASIDFFAIAAPSSDRLYDASGERERERLLTWPLTTGANLGWQYTPFQKVTGQYQFRFDGYVRDRTTSEDYAPPASTVTNGFGAAWEYRRGGYSLVFNGSWFTRAGWREWGAPGDPAPDTSSTYTKYGVSLSRDVYFKVFHKIHLNGAWFGGSRLDRFGKYQFGMFDDTRIHGVPASGVRFGELGALRGSYSFNIFEQYRLDLFLEHAWGRDRAFDDDWQGITGVGAAFNLRAPWNTMLRADVGKSFLPDRYRDVGSATLQIMLLKPLR